MNPELKDVAEDTCEHPPCTCPPIDGGKFCCDQCENAGDIGPSTCQCGHSDCTATGGK